MEQLTEYDEDRLRRAMTMIGDEAARDDAAPAADARAPWWRRRSIAAGALLAAAAVSVGGLSLTLGGGDPSQSPEADPGGQGQTLVEWVACARLIAEGDVVAVREAPEPGRVTVTFAVRDWIKPAQGDDQVTLDVVDPTEAQVREPWTPGGPLLIVVPERHDQPTDTFRGAELTDNREQIESALPRAATTECPAPWRAEN